MADDERRIRRVAGEVSDLKLTVATSFPAPKLWEAEQKPVMLPKNDLVYVITKKGREFIACDPCKGEGTGNGDHGAC